MVQIASSPRCSLRRSAACACQVTAATTASNAVRPKRSAQERTGKRARGILADNHREGLGEVVGVRERDEHARAALAGQ